MSRTPVSDALPPELTTSAMAVEPAHTWVSPFVPLGAGTVKVIFVSLHESTVRPGDAPGVPQVVPRSLRVTYPLPWLAPNPEPVIVTVCPADAGSGERPDRTGPDMAAVDVPTANTCSSPWSVWLGRITLTSVLAGSTGRSAEKT